MAYLGWGVTISTLDSFKTELLLQKKAKNVELILNGWLQSLKTFIKKDDDIHKKMYSPLVGGEHFEEILT